MKKKFMIYLFLIIAVSIFLVSATVGFYARHQMNAILENQKNERISQLKSRLIALDKMLYSIERPMADHRDKSIKEIAGRIFDGPVLKDGITRDDLVEMARDLKVSEIYLIDRKGNVFLTTFEPDQDFNLFSIDMEFTGFLKGMFGSGNVYQQRTSISNMTGIVNYYTYYSPENSDVILETSIRLKDYIVSVYSEDFYNYLFKKFLFEGEENDLYGGELDVYQITKVEGWSLINEGKKFDKDMKFVERVKKKGELRIDNKDKLIVYTCLKLEPTETMSFDEFIVEAVFDFRVLNMFSRNSALYAFIVSVLILVVVFFVSSKIFNSFLMDRIISIDSGLQKVKAGDYNLELDVKGDDELAMIAQTIDKMAKAIKEREEKLKYFADNLVESNSQLENKVMEHRRSEEQLEKAKKEADLYLDLMSHDLTNFNHTLQGNLALIERTAQFDEKSRKYFDAGKRQLAKSNNLISKVRAFSQVKNIDREDLHPIDVNGEILDAISMVKSLHSRKEIQVNYALTDSVLVQATDLLDSVLINILENAVKHGPADRVELDVSAGTEGEGKEKVCEIVISDNGPGVPDNMKEKIFDRFERIGTEKGMGLGLSLAREIVEKYGGSIKVEDRMESGKVAGSIFRIRLPMA